MIYLKNPLCLGMEESEYKEMLSLGGMRQKHFEKNEVILSAGCTTHVHKFYRVRHQCGQLKPQSLDFSRL